MLIKENNEQSLLQKTNSQCETEEIIQENMSWNMVLDSIKAVTYISA